MALDTTVGGASADSYITLAEWEAYAESMGWGIGGHGHNSSHEANLRRATMALDRRYAWKGYKASSTQARAWPRYDVGCVDGWEVPSDTIPQAIKDAQCELAWIIHEGGDPLATLTGGAVKREMVKASSVETETEYATPRETPRYLAVEGLVLPYSTGSGLVRVVRG